MSSVNDLSFVAINRPRPVPPATQLSSAHGMSAIDSHVPAAWERAGVVDRATSGSDLRCHEWPLGRQENRQNGHCYHDGLSTKIPLRRSGVLWGCVTAQSDILAEFAGQRPTEGREVAPQVLCKRRSPVVTGVRAAPTTNTTPPETCCASCRWAIWCNITQHSGEPKRTGSWVAESSMTRDKVRCEKAGCHPPKL